ncbi:hypothetical protein GF358_01070 [Candidatus Woesearchaeota archaeon]|nr:hypothetical protein [Candidatus Woesearchaeota archaeon]
MKETGEYVLAKFARPCAEILYRQGEISWEQYREMQKYYNKKIAPPRELLTAVFKNAVPEIQEFAERIKADPWNPELIRNFFINEHNKKVETRKGMPAQKELCKVHIGRVKSIENNNGFPVYIVLIAGMEKKISGIYLPNAKKNDYLITHINFAIEKQ